MGYERNQRLCRKDEGKLKKTYTGATSLEYQIAPSEGPFKASYP